MIQFVYFDLGNVLVGFSHHRAAAQLGRRCSRSAEEVHEILFDSPLLDSYERGLLDTPSLCHELRRQLSTEASDSSLASAISDIFWPLAETYPVVAALAQAGVPLGILSNTCDAHWQQITAHSLRWISRRFPTNVLSFETGARKPEPAIYDAAARAARTAPESIFFVDDRIENVVAAQDAGFSAHLFQGPRPLVAALTGCGVRIKL